MWLIGATIAVLVLFPIFGGVWLHQSKAKSHRRRMAEMEETMRARLSSIAAATSGTLVDGPALQTPHGRLQLVASGAPNDQVIDVAKFTAPLTTQQVVSIYPTADAAKMLVTRNLKRITPADPAVASAYAVAASDEAFAQSIATPAFVEKMKALDAVVRTRCRLQIAQSSATFTAVRGMTKPEELQGFHDGCVAVLSLFRPLLSPGAGGPAA